MRTLKIVFVLAGLLSGAAACASARMGAPINWHPSDALNQDFRILPLAQETAGTDTIACGKYFLRRGSRIKWLMPIDIKGIQSPSPIQWETDIQSVAVKIEKRREPVLRYLLGEKNVLFVLPLAEYADVAKCLSELLSSNELKLVKPSQEFKIWQIGDDPDHSVHCGIYFHIHQNRVTQLYFTGAFPFGFSIPWKNVEVRLDESKLEPTAEMPNRTSVILRMSSKHYGEATCLPKPS